MPDLKILEIVMYLQNFWHVKIFMSIFIAHSWISKIKHAQRLRIVDVYEIKKNIFLCSKNLFLWDNQKLFSPVTADSSPSIRPMLVFLSCPQGYGNLQKIENKLYGCWWLHREFQSLVSFQNIWFLLLLFFFSKDSA